MNLFNSVRIQTPESVELEFTLAGVGSRAVALVIDYTVLGVALLLTFWLWILVLTQLSQWDAILSIDTDTLQLWTTAISSVLAFGLYVGYFVGFETAWYGQTPGKRYAKIRVIRDDGQPVRLFQATLRSLIRPIDDIFFLGFFCILLSNREKRIGDWLAGTLVVQVDSRTAGQGLFVSEEAKAVGSDLLTRLNFDLISPDDFATVREYLQRRSFLTETARQDVGLQLARQLKGKAQLKSLPTEMTANNFLEAVYWSYQQRNQ
ncbi:MAG: hypothetical protein DCF25_03375 [Leptolyngbya foveolarum]|uniref:RDD domain-containing protein n=1 Tax=Leptolyngbya foveolarum TaxID=47253 RepID=A0A2W4UZD9_9CYAN|nr:MAG: hypothetical protein DCF25_03375 [Leptolyngbya foveolarum]